MHHLLYSLLQYLYHSICSLNIFAFEIEIIAPDRTQVENILFYLNIVYPSCIS